ncbi:hypothetical protein [Paenibacillus sp. DCT19]|uniref:hypothetical protein n=1 Tax=Paenibacillus sp. DCT19 TaxID=2211212 RepID=UPI000FE1A0DE|nr:hypothetical protein [Paenibacillus sp. DCT19]
MRVALYVCRVELGWSMMLSLDIRVDVSWWVEGASGRRVSRWLLLHEALPLSQASWMVEHFRMERDMDQWREEQWQAYVRGKIEAYERASGEHEARRSAGGGRHEAAALRGGGGGAG